MLVAQFFFKENIIEPSSLPLFSVSLLSSEAAAFLWYSTSIISYNHSFIVSSSNGAKWSIIIRSFKLSIVLIACLMFSCFFYFTKIAMMSASTVNNVSNQSHTNMEVARRRMKLNLCYMPPQVEPNLVEAYLLIVAAARSQEIKSICARQHLPQNR